MIIKLRIQLHYKIINFLIQKLYYDKTTIKYKFAKKLRKDDNLSKLVLYINHFSVAKIRLLRTIRNFFV
jgi:hypothetical protein